MVWLRLIFYSMAAVGGVLYALYKREALEAPPPPLAPEPEGSQAALVESEGVSEP